LRVLAIADSAQVIEVNERSSFVALESEWNALVDAIRPEPFHRHEFIRVWLDNFAPHKRWKILAARDSRGCLASVLPLVAEATSMFGMPVRKLGSAANVHSCRFDLISRNPEDAGRAFFEHLAASDSWDVLQLTDVPEGGGAWEILRAAERAGHPVGTWESMRSPFIPLPDSLASLETRLSPKFRGNLRRRRRHLEERGKLTFERVCGGRALERALEEAFWLESQGWKGNAGTAVAQRASRRGFYSELAKVAAQRGQLACYFLRLDGKPIAFHYALELRNRYFLLKPAYDEGLQEFGLGHLLVHEVIRDCLQRGVTEFDFLGPNMPWKEEWTEKKRIHTWLFVFRDSRFGRALCRAKFRWAPAARKLMQRWNR
jgi:CelD/BcsL family acetyltransferase involved in cellulose biosynthesis